MKSVLCICLRYVRLIRQWNSKTSGCDLQAPAWSVWAAAIPIYNIHQGLFRLTCQIQKFSNWIKFSIRSAKLITTEMAGDNKYAKCLRSLHLSWMGLVLLDWCIYSPPLYCQLWTRALQPVCLSALRWTSLAWLIPNNSLWFPCWFCTISQGASQATLSVLLLPRTRLLTNKSAKSYPAPLVSKHSYQNLQSITGVLKNVLHSSVMSYLHLFHYKVCNNLNKTVFWDPLSCILFNVQLTCQIDNS